MQSRLPTLQFISRAVLDTADLTVSRVCSGVRGIIIVVDGQVWTAVFILTDTLDTCETVHWIVEIGLWIAGTGLTIDRMI